MSKERAMRIAGEVGSLGRRKRIKTIGSKIILIIQRENDAKGPL